MIFKKIHNKHYQHYKIDFFKKKIDQTNAPKDERVGEGKMRDWHGMPPNFCFCFCFFYFAFLLNVM
jgi:hypothetical protein